MLLTALEAVFVFLEHHMSDPIAQEEPNQLDQEDQELLDGYTDSPTETPPGDVVEPAETTEPQPTEVTTPAEPKYVQVTEEDWNRVTEALKSVNPGALDKAFGKIGEVQRALQAIQAQTPSGQAVELTDEDFADLAAEFPELAALTKTAMNKSLSKLRGTGADPSLIKSVVDEGLSARQQAERQEQMGLVEEEYADWREQVSSQEFADWMKTQPERYQRRLGRAWDADTVLGALDKFQEHKAAQATEAERTARENAAKAAQQQTRQQRIQAAVTPQGAGGQPPPRTPEDDDFAAGYNS